MLAPSGDFLLNVKRYQKRIEKGMRSSPHPSVSSISLPVHHFKSSRVSLAEYLFLERLD